MVFANAISNALSQGWMDDALSQQLITSLSAPLPTTMDGLNQSTASQREETLEDLRFLLRADPIVHKHIVPVVSGLAKPLFSNIVAFLNTATNPIHDPQKAVELAKDRVAAAECLFLLANSYQLQQSHVMDLAKLLQVMLQDFLRVFNDIMVSDYYFITEHRYGATTYLSFLAFCAAVSPCSPKFSSASECSTNTLIKTPGMVADLRAWIIGCQKDLQRHLPVNSGSYQRKGPLIKAAFGYVSMATLALSVFANKQRMDSGKDDPAMVDLDIALEAFNGVSMDGEPRPVGGKVCKYIVKLMPSVNSSPVPRYVITQFWGQTLSHLTQYMLMVLKKVADDDRSSYENQGAADSRSYQPNIFANDMYSQRYGRGGDVGVVGLSETDGRVANNHRLSHGMVHYIRLLAMYAEDNGGDRLLKHDSPVVRSAVTRIPLMHLRQTTDTHKHARFEGYTCKVAAAYCELLRSLADNAENAEIVFHLLEDQVECHEMKWSLMVAQLTETLNGGPPQSAAQIVSSNEFSQSETQQRYLKRHQTSLTVTALHALERIATNSRCARSDVNRVVSVDAVCRILTMPNVSSRIAGASLSLLAALSASDDVAVRVWQLLDEMQILKLGHGTTSMFHVAKVDCGDVREEFLQEIKIGRFSLTVGFLKTVYACVDAMSSLRRPIPHLKEFINFVSSTVFCGFSSRNYTSPGEKWIVGALCAATLCKTFDATLWHATGAGESGQIQSHTSGILPLQIICATSKAPHDVIGEIIDVVRLTSSNPGHGSFACVRSCLELLTSIIVAKRQAVAGKSLTLDPRLSSSGDFFASLLQLVSSCDTVVCQQALDLAHLLSGTVLCNVPVLMHSTPDEGRSIVSAFVAKLSSPSEDQSYCEYPMELDMLNPAKDALHGTGSVNCIREKVVDLLIHNASLPAPSITSWLCGFPVHNSSAASLEPINCLHSVLRLVNDDDKHVRTSLGTKLARLVQLLLANTGTATPAFRSILLQRDAQGYLDDVYQLRAGAGNDELYRCGVILKTLAIEILHSPTSDLAAQHVPRLLGRADRRSGAQTTEEYLVQWLGSVLSDSPEMPSLPVPASFYPPTRVIDGVEFYDVAAMYQYFLSRSHNNAAAAKSDAEVVLQANECIAHYKATSVFVEGYCSLVEVLCAQRMESDVIRESLTHRHLFFLLQSVLNAIMAPNIMHDSHTSSAQLEMLSRAALSLLSLLHNLTASGGGSGFARNDEEGIELLNGISASLLQHGPGNAGLRQNCNILLFLFLCLPNMPIDAAMMTRKAPALFETLAEDACTANIVAQIGALRTMQKLLELPYIAKAIVAPENGSCGILTCNFVSRILQSADKIVDSTLTSSVAEDLGVVIQYTESVFAVLSTIAYCPNGAKTLLQANAIETLLGLRWWSSLGRALTRFDSVDGLSEVPRLRYVALTAANAILRWLCVVVRLQCNDAIGINAVARVVDSHATIFVSLLSLPAPNTGLVSLSLDAMCLVSQLVSILGKGSPDKLATSLVSKFAVLQYLQGVPLIDILSGRFCQDTNTSTREHYVASVLKAMRNLLELCIVATNEAVNVSASSKRRPLAALPQSLPVLSHLLPATIADKTGLTEPNFSGTHLLSSCAEMVCILLLSELETHNSHSASNIEVYATFQGPLRQSLESLSATQPSSSTAVAFVRDTSTSALTALAISLRSLMDLWER